MFCPNCGSEDRQNSQYCRACGIDIRAVRRGLEQPDVITASAVSARDEIGRAIAARIKDFESDDDLKKVAEDVLPQIEKFLESPQERRLRRIRQGVVTAMCGLGGALFFLLLSFKEHDLVFMIMAGVATFLIGLGIVLNGLLFTIPKEQPAQRSLDAAKEETERYIKSADTREELPTARQMSMPVSSVTEHTTHRLPNDPSLSHLSKPGAAE
ncbi:MAG TPA: zinc ribbon domain-containing protein [Pyrinomonadaceae bacterium]|jgi:hypothetical protein